MINIIGKQYEYSLFDTKSPIPKIVARAIDKTSKLLSRVNIARELLYGILKNFFRKKSLDNSPSLPGRIIFKSEVRKYACKDALKEQLFLDIIIHL